MLLRALLFSALIFWGHAAFAQGVMTGLLTDATDRRPLPGTRIENRHTGARTFSDSAGRFAIPAGGDQLIEFYAGGFKVLRLRTPAGALPSFFALELEHATIDIAEVEIRRRNLDFKTDSVRSREVYGRMLDLPTMSTLDVIKNPFYALSKRNRQIWAFQKEYAVFEQQKFIDYVFNARLVQELTGLQGEAAQRYMRRFRPSYDQIRAWSEYDFFAYVKRTGAVFVARGG